MGHSGSGKSTLLHLISGIDVPDSGSVVYGSDRGDVEVSALSARERTGIRRRHLGFVFQRDMLLPDLTAGENVALSCLLDGMTKKEALKVAMDRLTSVGLSAYSGQRPGELSGGEAQRVAIARATATDPQIIFADEPTASLDSLTAEAVVEELLQATTEQGRTLIMVTHDPAVASRCNHVAEIHDARIQGRPSQR
ncbi:MAG: ABC transporter ATP-binding protein [Peptidiphaga sp.]